MHITTSYNLCKLCIHNMEVQMNTSFVQSRILIRVMKGATPRRSSSPDSFATLKLFPKSTHMFPIEHHQTQN